MIEEHQKRIENGLNIPIPTLVMLSVRPVSASSWTNDLKVGDSILNIDKVISIAPKLSPFIKLSLVKDGLHDLFLSKEEARKDAYTQMLTYINGIFVDDRMSADDGSLSDEDDDEDVDDEEDEELI